MCEECVVLRERVQELEEELAGDWIDLPERIAQRLTGMEQRILRAMVATSRPRTREYLIEITRGVPGQKKDEINSNVIETKMCHLRAKLRSQNIRFETVWGVGWRLETASRNRIIRMLEAA